MTTAPESAAGMVLRMPLYRERPWISDGVWIAHESHPIFGELARRLPFPGAWVFDPADGSPRKVKATAPPIGTFVAVVLACSEPCVVEPTEYVRQATTEEAMQNVGAQVLDVIDSAGRVWRFDHDPIHGAVAHPSVHLSWRLAPPGDGIRQKFPVLIGLDRKDRPRFAVAGLTPETEPEPETRP